MAARSEITGKKPPQSVQQGEAPIANQPRAPAALAIRGGVEPRPERMAFSIDEFCYRHNISKAHYYNLKKLNLGPREMNVVGRKIISLEAERDWRRAREDNSPTDTI
jgi:hypothetical protein